MILLNMLNIKFVKDKFYYGCHFIPQIMNLYLAVHNLMKF